MQPRDEAELAEAIRTTGGPVRVRGGGTRWLGQAGAEAILETSGLSGITLHEPGALTIVARAGTALAEVEAVLAGAAQRLPFEPSDWRGLLGNQSGTQVGEPTIGGAVAANISGPRRIQAGACRDSLIGVRFVDGAGAVVKNGGRVMKNVTGYDLVKLMAGSWGTLGVLSEVSFKVLPLPGAAATLRVAVADAASAVAAMAAALTSPYDVTGAAWLPGRGAMIRVEGLAASVAYRSARLVDLLARHGAVATERDPARVAADWRAVRDVEPFHGRSGDVWRISVKPSDAPGVLVRLGGDQGSSRGGSRSGETGGDVVLDWGGGLIWVLLPEGTDARARIGIVAGHATLVRASGPTRRRIATFPPQPAPLAAIAAGLRAKFDPQGILNPGLMG